MPISRLYNYRADEKIKSAEVNAEHNMFVDAHNELESLIIDHETRITANEDKFNDGVAAGMVIGDLDIGVVEGTIARNGGGFVQFGDALRVSGLLTAQANLLAEANLTVAETLTVNGDVDFNIDDFAVSGESDLNDVLFATGKKKAFGHTDLSPRFYDPLDLALFTTVNHDYDFSSVETLSGLFVINTWDKSAGSDCTIELPEPTADGIGCTIRVVIRAFSGSTAQSRLIAVENSGVIIDITDNSSGSSVEVARVAGQDPWMGDFIAFANNGYLYVPVQS